ncbi:XRE family transcriptional regulator [Thioalkalivibrio sp. ALE12]|uniref:helix-turn-helix domain-containing protein n=1 Tax=Thioalkalivibrio sp. ALE12 TaxID=1158170 RepID=UPI000476EF6B|nr:XRE family transcriptional regulator [Thioalkalivibrio sp. ALE12]
MTLGARLKEARIASGLTQTQLAKNAGVSQQAVAKLEKGAEWSRHTHALAKALGVSTEWLDTGAGPRERTEDRGRDLGSAAHDAIHRFLRDFDPEESAHDQLVQFVEGLPGGAYVAPFATAYDLEDALDEHCPGWRDGERSVRASSVAEADAEFYAIPTVTKARQIPVVDYVEAGAPREIVDAYAKGDGHRMEWLDPASAESLGPYTFALEIRGRSMEPEFREGEIIIVDPDACVRPGDVVVARVNSDTEATVKKYRDRGRDEQGHPVYELVPLNPDYASITIDSSNPGTLIGPVVQHKRNLR